MSDQNKGDPRKPAEQIPPRDAQKGGQGAIGEVPEQRQFDRDRKSGQNGAGEEQRARQK